MEMLSSFLKYGLAATLFFALIYVLVSCKNSTLEPNLQQVGYTYFPVEKGQYKVYKVEESTLKYPNIKDTVAYLIKESVSDSFASPNGELAYRIIRYRFSDTNKVANYLTLNWRTDSVWSVRRGANTAIRTENNVAYLKLIFPIKEGTNWNVNQFNEWGSSNPETYRVRDYNKPFQVEGRRYNNTLKVLQRFDNSCLANDQRSEIYADGVGLIYKTTEVETYDQNCSKQVIQGRKVKQSLMDYGTE